jgi:hypothetical protein
MEQNPLTKTWKIVSIPLSIIGLASLSDTLVKWDDFILQIIISYQNLVHPFFEILFGWIPFAVPTWIYDYLTLGIIIGKSVANGKKAGEQALLQELNKNSIETEGPNISILSEKVKKIIANILINSKNIIFWPLTFRLIINIEYELNQFRASLIGGILESKDYPDIIFKISKTIRNRTLQWIGSIFIGFILLLIINYTIRFK